MNAYELAEYLATNRPDGIHYRFACGNAAIMIRQQADRIAHLEMLVANRNEIIDKLDLTKPQTKELSDEEILEIGNAVTNLIDSNEGWIEFARAILKKASEK
jgi:hypothetical protein